MDSSGPACTRQTVEEPLVLWLDYVAGHPCPADRVNLSEVSLAAGSLRTLAKEV